MLITDVPLWQQKAEASKIPRLNWQKILGVPLTKWLYGRFGLGQSKETTKKEICKILRQYYERETRAGNMPVMPLKKAVENAEVSVSARWAEWKRSKK